MVASFPLKVTRVAATHADHSPAMAQLAPALEARAAELYRQHRPRLAELCPVRRLPEIT